tara:strand:- start:529 stop:891 length:363 start_codon:yes stop_codon:yes gene_type:complete
MNRWVLLEHKVSLRNLVDIHYDFLVEDDIECLTWKLLQIPILNKGFVQILRQPNHRIVWLSRVEYELSEKRGFVKRIDHGTFINVSLKSVSQDLKIILDGKLLNGLFEISGNFCRLTKNN